MLPKAEKKKAPIELGGGDRGSVETLLKGIKQMNATTNVRNDKPVTLTGQQFFHIRNNAEIACNVAIETLEWISDLADTIKDADQSEPGNMESAKRMVYLCERLAEEALNSLCILKCNLADQFAGARHEPR